ncbi:hypothetical protein [Roseococcus sp. YIM B11640]|uniref:hypothetical protein n=1 Tax=Roseococcus sp. YIM B11640 TaxID=3133973 RepID=UPI003C7D5BEB
MSQTVLDIAPDDGDAVRDAAALAALTRECVVSGIERRAMLVRLSQMPVRLREPHHQRLLREALTPLLRPTRARVFELPGGDMVALSPPPGEHLEDARRRISQLLPDLGPETWLPILRLPSEAARLLNIIEAALGLGGAPPSASRQPLAAPTGAELDAAIRALATANLASYLRRRPVWRLATQDAQPEPIWTELRPHLADLAAALLPGRSLHDAPALAQRFRQAAERRMLAELAYPREARSLGDASLPLSLGAATSEEFLRLDTVLGPQARARLVVCIPAEDMLADPDGFTLVGRLARQRGWRLALDEVESSLLPYLDTTRLGVALLRLRARPDLLSGDAALRARLDAAMPAKPEQVVLLGADTPAFIAWAWQRGITRFMGKIV